MPRKPAPTPRRRYTRLTRWRRRRFLALLEECGNVRMAAELAGVGIKAAYRLRLKEPGFATLMAEAKAAASRRLAKRDARSVPGEDPDSGLVVRRGSGGQLRLMAAGPHCWEQRHDEIFLLHLRGTGNVRASARAAGFTPKVAHDRRKRMPAFAAAWARALPEARMRLEGRLLAEGLKAAGATYGDAFAAEPPDRDFDPWLALAVLKYWDRKRSGRTPGGD